MSRLLTRSLPALLAASIVAAQIPSAWATPKTSSERTPLTVGDSQETTALQEAAPQVRTAPQATTHSPKAAQDGELSEERRKELAEREQKNGAMEDYEGGLVIEVGAGVIILTLILIIVFVD